jgi:hypothetical protein
MKLHRTPIMPLCLLLAASACTPGGSAVPVEQSSLAALWSEEVLHAITEEKPAPPIGARFLALVHTAMYDAWAAYDGRAKAVHGPKETPGIRDEAAKRIAISYAAAEAILSHYPNRQAQVQAMMVRHGLPAAANGDAARVGKASARKVIEAFRKDGSNQEGGFADTTGYQPVNTVTQLNDPARWQPYEFTLANGQKVVRSFITPHWGKVKTFAVDNVPAMRPAAPAPAASQKYQDQAQEIIGLTANLTEKQKVIAEYWADGPTSVLPPGHWMSFAHFVGRRDRHTVDQDVKMLFLLANAMHDAAICCWDAKVYYDYIRPISAIRHLKKGQMIPGWRGPGQGFGLVKGEEWRPYQPASFITPPFAEHTSGHSTFSAAGAEILKRFTGSDSFGASASFAPGSLKVEPGVAPSVPVTLSWPTFSSAADEAGMSRRLGGIHFADGDLAGRQGGRRVAGLVWERGMALIEGR